MSRFPHLPETFILREMTELKSQGWQISLFPLIFKYQPVVHKEAEYWIDKACRIPLISRSVLAANARTFFSRPLWVGKLLARTLFENRASPKFLTRALVLFPKAVYLARLMQSEGIEHIHAHYATHPALVAWLIHQLTGISYSITVHAHDIFVDTTMLNTKLRDAAFIVAISDFNCNYLTRMFGPWVREKAHVIHCGIVPEIYNAIQPAPADSEKLEIISVGSLQPYKGLTYLIRACRLLRDWGIPFRCRIIGGGREYKNLMSTIMHEGLTNMVELLGPKTQEQITSLLPTAHCYVQPSIITATGKMEGIPVSLMEALACGLPVVATNISGIPELVRSGETGYLIPPANSRSIAEAICAIYESPGKARRFGQAGKKKVLADFDLCKNVAKLTELFQLNLGCSDGSDVKNCSIFSREGIDQR